MQRPTLDVGAELQLVCLAERQVGVVAVCHLAYYLCSLSTALQSALPAQYAALACMPLPPVTLAVETHLFLSDGCLSHRACPCLQLLGEHDTRAILGETPPDWLALLGKLCLDSFSKALTAL